MAILIPTTLPTCHEYQRFARTCYFYMDAIFYTSIAVTVNAVTFHVQDTSKLLVVVAGASTGGATTGTFLGTGASIAFSGYHTGVFDDHDWRYRLTRPDDTDYIVTSQARLPMDYYSLWRYRADVRTTTTVLVTVNTNVGTFILTQTVYNNWDVYRNNLRYYLDRGNSTDNDTNKDYSYSSFTDELGIAT